MTEVCASPQMIAVLVDKMIRTQIVDCAAVANWLFSQDMAHEFTRCGSDQGGGGSQVNSELIFTSKPVVLHFPLG